MDLTNFNIKLAVFDFDNTLAIHNDKEYLKHRLVSGEYNYYRQAFLHPDIFYTEIEKCKASLDILHLIEYLRMTGTKMFCLSGMHTNLHAKAKECFIQKHYGRDIPLLMIDSQEGKVGVVQMLAETYKCNPNEVLIVDDYSRVTNLMSLKGFNTVLSEKVGKITLHNKKLSKALNDCKESLVAFEPI